MIFCYPKCYQSQFILGTYLTVLHPILPNFQNLSEIHKISEGTVLIFKRRQKVKVELNGKK